MTTRARARAFNTIPPVPQNALFFPTTVTNPTSAFIALQFLNPQSNGLPFSGPGGAGWTLIREYTPIQQAGYFAPFWWSNNGRFDWFGPGSSNTYIGCGPYPQDGSASGTTHWEELAGLENGRDTTDNLAGGKIVVTQSVKRIQALRMTRNGNGSKTGTYWYNLPNVTNSDIIQFTSDPTFGEVDPPSPALTIGDSPWYADFQHERAAGYHGRYKLIAKSMTQSDILLESADMSRLVTSDGVANIWWGKTNWLSVDDLTCNYGTGRSFVWADAAHKATLVVAP
jgi:hypothetical protein